MYVLKTEGTDKIPDYIQIRDDSFALLTHFKSDSMKKSLQKFGITGNLDEIILTIKKLEYGKLQKI